VEILIEIDDFHNYVNLQDYLVQPLNLVRKEATQSGKGEHSRLPSKYFWVRDAESWGKFGFL
jgi:hypothetical protein